MARAGDVQSARIAKTDAAAAERRALNLRDLGGRVTNVIDRTKDLLGQLTTLVDNIRKNAPTAAGIPGHRQRTDRQAEWPAQEPAAHHHPRRSDHVIAQGEPAWVAAAFVLNSEVCCHPAT
jgi:hypothetical protein